MKKCSRCGRLGLFFYIDADGFCEKCTVEVKRQQEVERALLREKEREQQLTDAQAFLRELIAACAAIPAQPPLLARADSEDFSQWLERLSLEEMSAMEAACEKICTLSIQGREYLRLWEAFLAECVPVDGVVGYVRHPQIPTSIFNPRYDNFEKISAELISNAKALCEQLRLAKNFESFTYKVAGVSFKNGRRSRQTILKQIHFGDPPYKRAPEIRVEECEYEGEPAFAVYANEEQVGYIGKENIPEVLERWERYRGVKSFEIVGGGEFHYGMRICVEFYR